MDRARFGDRRAEGLVEVRRGDASVLAELTPGFWAVVATFEGEVTALRFERFGGSGPAAKWPGLDGWWVSSMDRDSYCDGVREVRRRIGAGTVYQVNLCRVLSHDLPDDADLVGLATVLEAGNPAPFAGAVLAPSAGVEVVCASPEAYLLREGRRIESRPIKGTAAIADGFLSKDYAENVMIVDLVRNDLSHVCVPGTVEVPGLLRVEPHPGLHHLVSDVAGTLREEVDWPEIFTATFPPGSVSGAPKVTALTAIEDLEPTPRGPYCGTVGWIDTRDQTAELAVGIRTFWAESVDGRRVLKFGTGAGITWDSDPTGEWDETELKAAKLIGLASGKGMS